MKKSFCRFMVVMQKLQRQENKNKNLRNLYKKG